MTKYKYILTYEDGTTMDSLEEYGDYAPEQATFDSYGEADSAAQYAVSCTKLGQEELHMSNPGDYDEDVEVTYVIEEVED